MDLVNIGLDNSLLHDGIKALYLKLSNHQYVSVWHTILYHRKMMCFTHLSIIPCFTYEIMKYFAFNQF